MTAFSTCWNNHRHTEGKPMVEEIVSMGFDTVELSRGLDASLIPGIRQAVSEGTAQICGLNDGCRGQADKPADASDHCELSSEDVVERGRAVTRALKTLELAADLSANYIVIRFGSIPMTPVTDKLEAIASAGGLFSREYTTRKLEAVKIRESLSPAHLDRVRGALEKIATRAAELGVSVGIESRGRYEDVPTEREITTIMNEFGGDGTLGYWHDFGHVQRKANLGFVDHAQWLEQISPHLVGCHIHDVVWPAREHMIPFEGSTDFQRLIPLIPDGIPIVWELSYRRKKKNIIAALPRWREMLGAAPAMA